MYLNLNSFLSHSRDKHEIRKASKKMENQIEDFLKVLDRDQIVEWA